MTIQERICQEDDCTNYLPVNAYPHRQFCNICQRERILKRRNESNRKQRMKN